MTGLEPATTRPPDERINQCKTLILKDLKEIFI